MKIPVAVIDTGIQHGVFIQTGITHEINLSKSNPFQKKRPSPQRNLHGTIVISIIVKYSPDICLYSVQVVQEGSLLTTPKTLIKALNWCIKARIPVINLSLGTIDHDDFQELQVIINKLIKNGQAVISTYHVNGAATMPAIHPDVFGVHVDGSLRDAEYYSLPEDPSRDFFVSSRHVIMRHDGSAFFTPVNASFATPTITAAIINNMILHPGKDLEYIAHCVQKNGVR